LLHCQRADNDLSRVRPRTPLVKQTHQEIEKGETSCPRN
jgi:hypothetical protein